MKRTERPRETVSTQGRRWAAGTLLSILLLSAVSAVYVTKTRTADVMARKRELPVYSVERDDGRIAISFDAAWGGEKTLKILDILDENGIKATFFLVDIWTQRFPELVKEIAARGHEIGNHSTTHPEMSKLNREKIAQELETMSANVESLIGQRPTLFRPPYGDYNNDVVLTARQNGYEVIQWSVDSLDWKNKGVQPLIDRATKNVKSGDIVLFHNDSQYIVEALPAVLESYRKQGLTVGPVSQVLLTGQITIDPQGRQRPAATTVPEV
ncbi:MAG: polysaccharide deacetylase family protein [Clostridia bacterium]|nr:polysaccharide deacetylase family protein [Clostridia bacterium]